MGDNIGTTIDSLVNNNNNLNDKENKMVDDLIHKLNKDQPSPQQMPPQQKPPNMVLSNEGQVIQLLKENTNIIILLILSILSNANIIESTSYFKESPYLFHDDKSTYLAIVSKSLIFVILYYILCKYII